LALPDDYKKSQAVMQVGPNAASKQEKSKELKKTGVSED